MRRHSEEGGSSSDSEDIPWGVLQDLDWEEAKQKEREEIGSKREAAVDEEYEILEYDVRGLRLVVKQQKRLGIGFQMWPAVLSHPLIWCSVS